MSTENGEWMSAQEAIQAFMQAGLSEPTFRRRIKEGLIKGTLPEGKRRGAKYPRNQVLAAIANERPPVQSTSDKRTSKLKGAVFFRVEPEQMPEIAPIIHLIFNTYPDIKRWSSWIEKNPDIAFAIRSENKIVGCGFITPLKEEKILNILSHEVTPPTTADDIERYVPGVPYYLYARTIGVLQQGFTIAQRRLWAGILVRNLMKSVVELGSKGIVIEKIYGRNDTIEGMRLMRDMGFCQIRSSTSHKNFVIDVRTSGIEMIQRYEAALNGWKLKYGGDGI